MSDKPYTPDDLARDRTKIQEMQHARQHHCACKIAARALDALEQAWVEVERLKAELRHRDDYDNRVPDPRRHKYFDYECSDGCKSLALRNEIERLSTTKDGHRVTPGMKLYYVDPTGYVQGVDVRGEDK